MFTDFLHFTKIFEWIIFIMGHVTGLKVFKIFPKATLRSALMCFYPYISCCCSYLCWYICLRKQVSSKQLGIFDVCFLSLYHNIMNLGFWISFVLCKKIKEQLFLQGINFEQVTSYNQRSLLHNWPSEI